MGPEEEGEGEGEEEGQIRFLGGKKREGRRDVGGGGKNKQIPL